MLKKCRQKIINYLWQEYEKSSIQMRTVQKALHSHGMVTTYLDHFAVIDLPGPNSGIYHMQQIFSALGFVYQGQDYLADRQNDFTWMCEEDSFNADPKDVLPQAVIADFRLDELPREVKCIIEKYSKLTYPTPVFNVKKLAEYVKRNDKVAAEVLMSICKRYFAGRDWPLPSVQEYLTVKEFNELLAWVLINGRKPNHFTLSVHLLEKFKNLEAFTQFVTQEIHLPLNDEGAIVKGGPHYGIAQAATVGLLETQSLSDGSVTLKNDFVEFVWRYPRKDARTRYWGDYYTGFVAKFADKVIDSLL